MPISSEGNGWARLFVYFRLKFHPYFSCFFFILYDTEILISCQNKKLFTVLVKDFLTPCIFTSIDFQVINVFSSTLCLYFEECICVLCLHPLPHPFPCSTPPASQLPLMSFFYFLFYFMRVCICTDIHTSFWVYLVLAGYVSLYADHCHWITPQWTGPWRRLNLPLSASIVYSFSPVGGSIGDFPSPYWCSHWCCHCTGLTGKPCFWYLISIASLLDI